MGRDSSVSIAAHYGLDGPGIESRWGRDFLHASRPTLVSPSSCTMGTRYFQGVKRPGRGVDHPLPSSVEVKERVQLYPYSPSVPSWPVIGWTLPLTLPIVTIINSQSHGPGVDSISWRQFPRHVAVFVALSTWTLRQCNCNIAHFPCNSIMCTICNTNLLYSVFVC